MKEVASSSLAGSSHITQGLNVDSSRLTAPDAVASAPIENGPPNDHEFG